MEIQRLTAAASNPERDHVLSNPFELRGRRGEKTPVRGPGDGVVKEEDPAGRGERADETGETETEEERLLQLVMTEDPLGRREPVDSAREEAPDTTAAREATLLEKHSQARQGEDKMGDADRRLGGKPRNSTEGNKAKKYLHFKSKILLKDFQ
ncbi:hypothetical protein NDU88_006603 [Pleurodeles waltl]|uniref:Uncharacterized protein n=1 Tax=Pleurodeles waltl TaxID=8319 RepID=A0AAV7WER3_PLEWA|nr:hypothetical protein NDU88_006603 [Pleurodeles waltl]